MPLAIPDTPPTLVVWRSGRRRVLLVGYEIFDVLKPWAIPALVREKQFGTREQARQFVIAHWLAARNPSDLEVTYVIGLCHEDEKEEHGGDRRSVRARSILRGKTAEALADKFHARPGLIRRAAELARAVQKLVALHGPEIMAPLFSRKANLSVQAVIKLAGVEPARLRILVGQLRIDGKLPRFWGTDTGEPATIALPRDPEAMARQLARRFERTWLLTFAAAFQRTLSEQMKLQVFTNTETPSVPSERA